MLDTAFAYLRSGLCVLPAGLALKYPTLTRWREYQSRLPTESELRTWFANASALCILTGAVSGNLELLDFDFEAELFQPWYELVELQCPGLVEKLTIERSQSGGRHLVYRCETAITGSRKLAQRTIVAPDSTPVEYGGKQHKPRKVGNQFEFTITLIETRGEAGLFLCAPTPGYVLEQGSFEVLPILTDAEHAVLVDAALSLNEVLQPVNSNPCTTGSGRPGDEFNERGDVPEVILRHGWQPARPGSNVYWRRPGKQEGCSATLHGKVFYVFSTNAAPFEPQKGYAPFSVYALLEHAGDFPAAAAALRAQGYGETTTNDVDLSGIIGCITSSPPADPPTPTYTDPGSMPESLFRVPGFVSEVMDHCLATAPYPNVPLAFCGALALQAMLAGRKVCDASDNRTNLYILALANSSVGKDWSRKLNTSILHRVGLVDALGEKFASGEGIQDSLFRTPSMLFQTDEIDGLLQTINKSQDARHENILGTLLTMYSAANSIYPMRRKAGREAAGAIDQPCLVVYGTAIPTHYYTALSQRMLTNGFFARMLIIESGRRSAGQEPGIISPSERIIDTARWWADYLPGTGNLERFHPVPQIVEADGDARDLITVARQTSEAEYAEAESRGDQVGMTVWGRVAEQIRKLALLYAVSANHITPRINNDAVRWSTDFILHQTRRMLFMANNHVAENPFHADCLKFLRKLREAPEQTLSHSILLKRMKMDAKSFSSLIDTLCQQGEIEIATTPRAGWSSRCYRLARGETSLGG